MARPSRLHVKNGLYFVALKGNAGSAIFRDSDDYAQFSLLIGRALKRHRCQVHAFCWLKTYVLMAIQTGKVHVGRVVQHATSRYVRYVHAKFGGTGSLFQHHHFALLVQRSAFLLPLVRYIHRAPVRDGLVLDPSDYAWSGDRAYRDTEKIPWLTTHVVKEMLTHAGNPGPISYNRWMSQRDDLAVARLFERGRKDEPRVVGSDAFVAAVRNQSEPEPQKDGLDRIIAAVARTYGVSLKSIFSRSRRRQHVFVRALIAWQATQSGAATTREVAARLRRDPSTLWSAVERYRTLRPDLFPEPASADEDSDFELG